MPLVLASASPRRQELLRSAGIEFIVHPASIPEICQNHESPKEFAERMAREKAAFIWAWFENPHSTKNTLGGAPVCVLGADTVVVVGDEVLGKPVDEKDAARMLHLLSGRVHRVITGVCLVG